LTVGLTVGLAVGLAEGFSDPEGEIDPLGPALGTGGPNPPW
jgi:hypothetical protein